MLSCPFEWQGCVVHASCLQGIAGYDRMARFLFLQPLSHGSQYTAGVVQSLLAIFVSVY